MATGSNIQVTSGTGPRLATGPTYTETGATVQDEKVILGEQYYPSYIAGTDSLVSTANAAKHLIQLMAGSSLKVRVRQIVIWQQALVTTGGFADFRLMRLTSAGTGGGAVSINPLDTTDAAAGAVGMALPTANGTEGVAMRRAFPYMVQTIGASPNFPVPLVTWEFEGPRSKPLIIPAGTSNGIAVRNQAAVAAGVVMIEILFDETSF